MQPNSELFHSAAPDPCPSPVPEPWPSPSPQPSPLPILSQLKYDKFTLKMIGLNYNAIIELNVMMQMKCRNIEFIITLLF